MSKVKIISYPAFNGESFLIQLQGDRETNILIDTGYVSTSKSIIKDLSNLKHRNLKLDLMVLTHIDNDHINGAREILKQEVENEETCIEEIWYNDYFKLIGNLGNIEKSLLDKKEIQLLNRLKSNGYKEETGVVRSSEVGFLSAQYLVQYLVGSSLEEKWNKSFNGEKVCIEQEPITLQLNEEVEITILGPTRQILEEQYKEWEEHLKQNGYSQKLDWNLDVAKAFEMYSIKKNSTITGNRSSLCSSDSTLQKLVGFESYDSSIANRSSISCIIHFKGKNFLFLGDSSPIDMEESIEKYLNKQEKKVLECVLIKLPHHGSKYNWSNKLNRLLKCNKYLISSNAQTHMHPDKETIAKIICSSKEEQIIYCNYKPIHLNKLFELVQKEGSYKSQIEYANSKKTTRNNLMIEIQMED